MICSSLNLPRRLLTWQGCVTRPQQNLFTEAVGRHMHFALRHGLHGSGHVEVLCKCVIQTGVNKGKTDRRQLASRKVQAIQHNASHQNGSQHHQEHSSFQQNTTSVR